MASGLVILDKDIPAEHLYFEIQESLKAYDASLSVKPYLFFSRENFITSQRQADKNIFAHLHKKMTEDPEGFAIKYGDPFVEYVKTTWPARLVQSDDEVYERTIGGFIGNDGLTVDSSGDIYTTKNPKAKFKNWERGGIFKHAILNTDGSCDEEGELRIKGFDTLRRSQLKMMTPFNILVEKNGTWADRWEFEEKIRSLQINEESPGGGPIPTFDDYTHKAVIVDTDPEDWLLVVDIDRIPSS